MAGVTEDALSRTLRILQHRRGHRAASDDVVLAWAASEAAPEARRVLDLGSGKGTVALLLLRRLAGARVVGVEAEPEHHALALQNAALNGLEDRYAPRLGDLREAGVLAGCASFDLVCGAPPFMPRGSGVLPSNPLRAAARFELRGGVCAYARTAADHLAPDGRVVLLMDGLGGGRVVRAVVAAGLAPHREVLVRPRPDRPPTYVVVVAGRDDRVPDRLELSMRGATGDGWSPAYARVRAALDLP